MLFRLTSLISVLLFSFSVNASTLDYGKYSPIFVELRSEPYLFKGQASVPVLFDVLSITPVNRGVPQSYYDRALPNQKECKVTLPISLSNGSIQLNRDAQITCKTSDKFGYVGLLQVSLSYLNPRTNKYIDLDCELNTCSRFRLPKGYYLMRVQTDSKLTYRQLFE